MAGLDIDETQTAVRMTVKLSPQAAAALKKISEERSVTITESLRVSTRHRSWATPAPVRSLTATAAPTEETQARMCS